ncbi:MAG: toll/interleukin-1 receptor domain-containing protein [Anaerolineales bacterium]|jgi:hypothetical protein
MAFIKGYDYDIFISYAHVDNLVAQEGEEGWISRFHKCLEIGLAQRIGRMGLVNIWRDKKLEGDHLFDPTIQEGLEKSALFVAITSNGYLASEYCQQELRMFVEKARAETYGLSIRDRTGIRSRISTVLINNIPKQKWPEAFQGAEGYPLYDAEDDEDLGIPSDPGENLFKNQLKHLVDSLDHKLRAFRTQAEQATAEETTKPPSKQAPEDASPAVFLADVTDSLRTTHNLLASELERKGIKVVTGIPPPYESASHAEKVTETIQNTAMSVHLLDQFPGREVEGEPGKTYPNKQVELVKDARLPQIIWVPRELDLGAVGEATQRAFLDRLENGPRQEARYTFVRSTSTTLLPQILEKLALLQAAQTITRAKTPAILLDTHIRDQLHALELSKFLLQNRIQPYVNPQEDDPNKNMDILEARLRQVNTLMVLFGSVSAEWVRQRLGAALQLSVIRALAIKAFYVVAVPPEKNSEELDFHAGPIRIRTIDNSRGDLNPNLLAPVLDSLWGGAA